MKYTRKSFLKYSGTAGLTLFVPSAVSIAYNYIRNRGEYSNNICNFKSILEKYFETFACNNTKPDVLILNGNSMAEYDFVFLKYNRGFDEAPSVVFLKDDSVRVRCIKEFKEQVNVLKDISQCHNVFIYSEKDIKKWFEEVNNAVASQLSEDLIKRIKNCGIDNLVSEELYPPVSVVYVYAEKYNHEHYRSKAIS